MKIIKNVCITVTLLLVIASCTKDRDASRAGAPAGNQLPVIFNVTISPSPVNILSPITVYVNAKDPDGDRVSLKYRWLVNGEEKPATGPTLNQEEFKKGDTVTVIVTPDDGKAEGEPYRVDIEVSNLPPKVENIEFSPPVPTVKDSIKVITTVSDPENDPVHLRYVWFVDSKEIEGIDSDTLPNRFLKKGIDIHVEVIPSDEESTGASLISPKVTIANSAPIITSNPPTSVNGDRYTYRVIANDPDGDTITYSLENAPEGMTIDRRTGTVNWQLTPDSRGEYTFSIIAEDADGAKGIQTVTVSF